MKVFVVAGHGKKGLRRDDGASFGGTTERAEVIEIANELVQLLMDHGVGTEKVGIDTRMTLAAKTRYIRNNEDENDLVISVHINAAGENKGTGVETWYETTDRESHALANRIVSHVADETKLRNRGAKDDRSNRLGRLAIVRDVKSTAVLVECGFITHQYDRSLLMDEDQDNTFARGIAKGILEGLQIGFSEAGLAWYIDVPPEMWYHDDLKLCVQEGIFKVPKGGRFNATRERVQLAVTHARHLRTHHNVTLLPDG